MGFDLKKRFVDPRARNAHVGAQLAARTQRVSQPPAYSSTRPLVHSPVETGSYKTCICRSADFLREGPWMFQGCYRPAKLGSQINGSGSLGLRRNDGGWLEQIYPGAADDTQNLGRRESSLIDPEHPPQRCVERTSAKNFLSSMSIWRATTSLAKY